MSLLHFEKFPQEVRSLVQYRNLKSNERLYLQGDAAKSIFGVLGGFLGLLNHTAEGNTVNLYVIGPGEYVSEAALFADRYCSDVVSETSSRVAIYPKEAVLAALDKDAALAREFMVLQARRFNLLRARMELRSIRSARERVFRYLEIAKLPGANAPLIDRPLKSIANDIGLTHETLYRTLARLRHEGVIPKVRKVPRKQS